MSRRSLSLSRRTAWDRAPTALAEAVDRARSSGRPLLDLTETNPTAVSLDYPWDAIAAAVARGARAAYVPEPFGQVAARSAVAERYAPGVDPSRVMLTASTSEAYSFLFRLLADPGDVVLVPRPSYPLLGLLGDLDGVSLESYPLAEDDGWRIDFDGLDKAARRPGVRAVVVVSPNNPTGSSLTGDELERLAERCAERGWALIADEVFADYRREGLSVPLAAAQGRLSDATWFSLGGLSKSAGLPGMKLAWTVCGGSESVLREALARLDVIADTFLSPAMPVQVALPELLALSPAIRASIQRRIDANVRALAGLRASAVSALPVPGGWSAILRVPATRTDDEWARTLIDDAGVLVQPGGFFDFERPVHLVVSLLPPEDTFATAVARISAVFSA